MEQTIPSEATSFSAIQKRVPPFLWSRTFHCRVHNSHAMAAILSHVFPCIFLRSLLILFSHFRPGLQNGFLSSSILSRNESGQLEDGIQARLLVGHTKGLGSMPYRGKGSFWRLNRTNRLCGPPSILLNK